MNTNNTNRIKQVFSESGIDLTDRQAEQFEQFYEMLVEKNKVMNLTAITEFEDVLLKHFIDSVYGSELFMTKDIGKVIDVGTGAGFPGIPLKILYPEKEFTLLDSLMKRLVFLDEVINQLSLDKTVTVHARAEDAARDKRYREQFDCCVSRAVANLSTLSEYTLPFIKVGGLFISYKSGNSDAEIQQAKKAVHLLGGEIEKVEKLTLPSSDIERSIIFIRKIHPTSRQYPRKAGVPGKTPLT